MKFIWTYSVLKCLCMNQITHSNLSKNLPQKSGYAKNTNVSYLLLYCYIAILLCWVKKNSFNRSYTFIIQDTELKLNVFKSLQIPFKLNLCSIVLNQQDVWRLITTFSNRYKFVSATASSVA